MKKNLVITVLLISFLSFSKDKIVIFNLQSNVSENRLVMLANESLITAVVEAGKYEVLERDQLKNVLNELKLISSDDFTDKEIVQIGELAKASVALLGSLTEHNGYYTINIRLINIESGVSLLAKNITVYHSADLIYAIKDIGFYISGKQVNSRLYSNKMMFAVPLSVSGTILSLGSCAGLIASIYSFSEEEKKYIDDPYYNTDKYLQARNLQVTGIALGTIGMIIGVTGLSASIPFYIQGNGYKREFAIFTEKTSNKIVIGCNISF